MNNKVDVHSKTSDKKGAGGALEGIIRTFRGASHVLFTVPLILICVMCMGVAMAPAVALFAWVQDLTSHSIPLLKYFSLGMSIAFGFFAYGISIILVVPLVNFLLPFRVKKFRGPWYSTEVMVWYIHNALTQIVRYSFLDFITPSPLNTLFYRLMGMKIGKGSVINTSNISDPCMIEIGDHVTIGGSATLMAHYGQKGFLIIEPLIIKDGANIGLRASLMGDVIIEKNATVLAHSVVFPKTRVGEGEKYPAN